MTAVKRKLGWRPEPASIRDFPYGKIRTASGNLDLTVDLRAVQSGIEDQKNIGSCVGNAAVGALEHLDVRGDGKWTDLSRLFVYWFARDLQGWAAQDSGCFIRDAVKVLAQRGVPPESAWPYDVRKWAKKPGVSPQRKAASHKIKDYHRIDMFPDIFAALGEGLPVIFGMSVYDSFVSAETARSGVVPMPNPKTEAMVGGHAMLIVGCRAKTRTMLVRNSWGKDWGQAGYCEIPYAMFDPVGKYVDDLWVIRT
jgi:C1A family cysteine protease